MTDYLAQAREFTVGDYTLSALVTGHGRRVLILHDEMGYPGAMHWEAALARSRELIMPLAPGFGIAPAIDWLRNVRDLAVVYSRWLREQQWTPTDVIGFSFGGWLAAEMAVNDPSLFRRMVLVSPLGIKPNEGVILDAFELTHHAQLTATVHDPKTTPEFAALYGGAPTPAQVEAFEDARATAARLAWQPYLHNPSLPHLLSGIGKLPSLILWGEKDRVVPRSSMEIYQRSLPAAELVTLPNCGHRPEIEQRDMFLNTLHRFLA